MPSRGYYVAHAVQTGVKSIWARLVAFLRSLGRKK